MSELKEFVALNGSGFWQVGQQVEVVGAGALADIEDVVGAWVTTGAAGALVAALGMDASPTDRPATSTPAAAMAEALLSGDRKEDILRGKHCGGRWL